MLWETEADEACSRCRYGAAFVVDIEMAARLMISDTN